MAQTFSSLVTGTHFLLPQIWRGRRAARSSTSQGSAEGANGEVSKGKLISDHSRFSSCEGRQGAANGQESWAFFRDAQDFGRLDAGSRAGFTSSRPPPPWTSVFQFSSFLYDVWF